MDLFNKRFFYLNFESSDFLDHIKASLIPVFQEIQVNGSVVPCNRPFAQQMGMGGKYNDMERMAMSHPAFLDQAERPQVVFGSHSQFQVGAFIYLKFS